MNVQLCIIIIITIIIIIITLYKKQMSILGITPGGTPQNFGWGVPHGSQNPDPISDQNI